MTNQALVPKDIDARYEVREWRNGLAILSAVHPEEWQNMLEVLRDFTLLKSDVVKPGGSKGLMARKLDSHFTKLGWKMEQQGHVLRPGPEQFPPIVRPARNRRWRDHHPMHRATADFQAAGERDKLW